LSAPTAKPVLYPLQNESSKVDCPAEADFAKSNRENLLLCRNGRRSNYKAYETKKRKTENGNGK
jgi:hypothetical protein